MVPRLTESYMTAGELLTSHVESDETTEPNIYMLEAMFLDWKTPPILIRKNEGRTKVHGGTTFFHTIRDFWLGKFEVPKTIFHLGIQGKRFQDLKFNLKSRFLSYRISVAEMTYDYDQTTVDKLKKLVDFQ